MFKLFKRHKMNFLRKLIREDDSNQEDIPSGSRVAQMLGSIKKISHLKLSTQDYYPEEDMEKLLQHFCNLKNLKTIFFKFYQIDDGFVSAIINTAKILRVNPGIKEFIFKTQNLETEDQNYFILFRFMQKCKHISRLSLEFSCGNFNDQTLAGLSTNILKMKKVNTMNLSFRESEISNNGMVSLANDLALMINLRNLTLQTDMDNYLDTPVIMKKLSNLKTLDALHIINYCLYSSEQINVINRQISRIHMIKQLELKFAGHSMRRVEMLEFCRGLSKLINLEFLKLQFTYVGFSNTKSLLYISNALNSLISLKKLALHIGDYESPSEDDVDAFCKYINTCSLQELKFHVVNDFSGKILELARAISNLKSLNKLYLNLGDPTLQSSMISEFVKILEYVILNKKFHFSWNNKNIFKQSNPCATSIQAINSFEGCENLALKLKGNDLNTHLIISKLNQYSSTMSDLKNLKLEYSNYHAIANPQLQEIGKLLPNFPLLKELALVFKNKSLTDEKSLIEIFNGVTKLNNLASISIKIHKNDSLTDDQLFKVGKTFSMLQNLESIELELIETKKITAYGLSYLYKCSSNLRNLKNLKINLVSEENYDMSYIAWEEFTSSLSLMQNLESLDINIMKFKNIGGAKLNELESSISKLVNLKTLNLSLTYSGDSEHLETFLASFCHLVHLEKLDLNISGQEFAFNDDCFRNLAQSIAVIKGLKQIIFKASTSSLVTDHGFKTLVESCEKCKLLNKMKLCLEENPNISDASLEYLGTKLISFKELSSIEVEFPSTNLISPAGVLSFYDRILDAPKLFEISLKVNKIHEKFTYDSKIFKGLSERFGPDNFSLTMPTYQELETNDEFSESGSSTDGISQMDLNFFDEPTPIANRFESLIEDEASKDLDAFFNHKASEEHIPIIPGAMVTLGYRYRRYQNISIATSSTGSINNIEEEEDDDDGEDC